MSTLRLVVIPSAAPPPVGRGRPRAWATRRPRAEHDGAAAVAATANTGIDGLASIPSPSATARHTSEPTTTPSGTPTTMPMAANVVACQPIVARTWRRSKPRVLSSASSRRRRRTPVTRPWPTASGNAPSRSVSATGSQSICRSRSISTGSRGRVGAVSRGTASSPLPDPGPVGAGRVAPDEVPHEQVLVEQGA